jgi:hypothetical protein
MKTIIGYNIKFGSHGYGAFKDYPSEKIIEMPVDEAFMTGYAIGRAVAGDDVLLFFERTNFLFEAMSELLNLLKWAKGLFKDDLMNLAVVSVHQEAEEKFDVGNQHVVSQCQEMYLDRLFEGMMVYFVRRKDQRFKEKMLNAAKGLGAYTTEHLDAINANVLRETDRQLKNAEETA